MPRRRRHHDDHVDHQPKKPTAQVQQAARQTVSIQLMAEEAVWESSLGGQAETLSNPQFLPAQRSSLAVKISQIQGNRHLGQVLSSSRQNEQTRGGDRHFIQREGAPGAGHATIQYGSRGQDVEEAQAKLNSAGANPPLAVDGIFGPLTRAAVIEFQTSHDLSPDGIVGPLTWGALDQVGPEPPGPEPPGPGPEPPGPGPEPPGPGPEPPGPGPEVPAERWSDDDSTRLAAQTSDTGALNAYQASRAMLRVYALTESEYSSLRSLLDEAGSDMEWAFLLKAGAAQRSISDISDFAERIRGMSERWLMRNLMVVDLVNDLTPGEADPEERGIMQQYGNSCGPTSVQLIHAQADPIYALELRSSGPIDEAPNNAVSNPETIENEQLADEQSDMLNAHVATGGNAPTDRSNPAAGAWVESDMTALANATGVSYTTKFIPTDVTLDAAMDILQGALATGVHVPIVVGGAPGQIKHYVVVLIASGDRYLIHDVATGQTVWRTDEQFRTNTLVLPSGWSYMVAIDEPTLVPPPLPQPPTPTSG